jgi:hypothetical protein
MQCDGACWAMADCQVNLCSLSDVNAYACARLTCRAELDGYRRATALSDDGAGCLASGKCLDVCVPKR